MWGSPGGCGEALDDGRKLWRMGRGTEAVKDWDRQWRTLGHP